MAVMHALQENGGIHVQKQPPVRLELLEIVYMDRIRQAVERQDVREIPSHGEGIERRDRMAAWVGRAHQALESDRAAVGDAENRLKVAADGQSGEFPRGLMACLLQQAANRLQVYAGGRKFRWVLCIHRVFTDT